MSLSTHSGSWVSRQLKRRSASSQPPKTLESADNNWHSFLGLWERADLIRSFVWSQDSADETALFSQFIARIRCFFKIDFCFAALRREDGEITQAGVPEALLEQLPADFVRRSMDLVANSRIPVTWHQHSAKTGFQTVVVTPLSPSVGQPLGLLMLGHSRSRHFTKAELFLLQSLAGEISWAVRELRFKRKHNRLLSAASLELKNSLNMAPGECALLREIEALELTTEQRRKLTSIEKNTRETLGTINSFLDATIAEEDRFVVPRENVNLVAVIEATLVSCRDKAREAGVELQAQYAADLPREYFTDPTRFRHVLRNLADYAIEISEQGRVLLSVRKNFDLVEFNLKVSEPRTEVSTEAEGGRQHAGDCAHGRLEIIRENLKMLDGQWHFVKRPGEGIEIGICLA